MLQAIKILNLANEQRNMKNFKIPAKIAAMAPCLNSGPYRDEARRFIGRVLAMPQSAENWMLRTFLCYAVFHKSEAILTDSANPVPAFRRLLRDAERMLDVSCSVLPRMSPRPSKETFHSVEEATGEHYRRLFGAFRKQEFDEAARLIRTRFERNRVSSEALRGTALDAGCGGGRYSVALKRLGFRRVVGLDVSKEMTKEAANRIRKVRIHGVRFVSGSTLRLPFRSDSFDFVFSNGVLHHTADWKRGVAELLRVLKPGGYGFLYLIERPGGIFWDRTELLRILMRGVEREYAYKIFELLGVQPNRRFYILDHVMVPINLRLRPDEIRRELEKRGAQDIRRFERGTDFDRVEQIWRKVPHARIRYGAGENRYFFKKG